MVSHKWQCVSFVCLPGAEHARVCVCDPVYGWCDMSVWSCGVQCVRSLESDGDGARDVFFFLRQKD